MNSPSFRLIETSLKILTFPKVGEALSRLRCPDCGTRLDLHQPETGFPDRMLGTCQDCHRWFVADFAVDGEKGVIVFLPDANFFLGQ